MIQNRRLFDLYHQLVTGKVEKNLPQQSTKAKATKPISILPKAQSRLKIIFKISTILQLKILDQTLPQNLDINSVPTSRQHFSFKVCTANLLQNLEKTSLLILTNIKIKLSTKHQIKISTKLSSKHSLPSTSRNLNHGKGGLTTKDCVAVVWSVIYDIFLNSHKRLIGWSAERTRVFLQQTTKPALNPTEGGLEYQQ